MSFIAPYSPPDEHLASSSKVHPGGGLSRTVSDLAGPAPRTVDRKRNGLRKTRTESSLPTPPRTRDRRTSRSPGAEEVSATERRATSSSRPFSLPSDQLVDGLYPAPTIESSSGEIGSSSNGRATNAFLALSPPLTGTRTKKRHPAHRQVDSLGPTRRAALKGGYVSVEWKAPPPPAFVPEIPHGAGELPPLPTAAAAAEAVRKEKKMRRNRDPAKGPIWEDGNPFLAGIGLKDKGLVADKQRVGMLEEKETIGYVFRGTKTVFANPFFTGPSYPSSHGASSSRGPADLDMAHPDFTPVANPPPRLLFPALAKTGSSSSGAERSHSRGAYPADEDHEDDDEELGVQAVPRRLFSGAQAERALAVDSDDDEDADDASTPAAETGRGRATGKRPLENFGGSDVRDAAAKRRNLRA